MVPPQYFQSIIALELAISGALLWQIRYFEHGSPTSDRSGRPLPDPWVRLLVAVILGGTLIGSLLGIVREAGEGMARFVAIGLTLSMLPILLRVLPPLRRGADTSEREPRTLVTIVGLLVYAAIAAGFIVLLST